MNWYRHCHPYLSIYSVITPATQAYCDEFIARLPKGKTLVTIAHRLSTIKDSDQIIVLEKGNKIAGGTHEQLLKDCKVYKTMWNNHIGAEVWSIKGEVILC